ncbi:hypothetical protein EZV62_025552 [Acer yangbiense]|uniref:DUF674 domain-containing protein n=1 Tax=Acer yangbiense TaxID=1000413 RepID=A0A5C7GYT3_9ROSI|nr:hypothetical protein EZV62_025552 [Acer yangbiense]
MASSQVKLKLLIDTNSKKVLFAEAGKDFVDFLFYFLSLPVSTVVRIIKEKGDQVGCLNDLYNSLENLNEAYIQPSQNKTTLLHHESSLVRDSEFPLLLSGADQYSTTTTTTRNVYMCPAHRHNRKIRIVSRHVSDVPNFVCPHCKVPMSVAVPLVNSSPSFSVPANYNTGSSGATGEGGFVKGVVTYMVMDNLEVKPMSTTSSIAMLNEFNLQNVIALREKVVVLGVDEGLSLLKASMECKNVLTRVVFYGEY